jgi:hypothetical protein
VTSFGGQVHEEKVENHKEDKNEAGDALEKPAKSA